MFLELFIADELAMENLGNKIGTALVSGDIIYLSGVLGAGKTTLARGILQGLGFTGCVTSPTFTLMNIYLANVPVYHFDFYRLEKSELYELGLDDYLGQEGISIIEWADVGSDVLPQDGLWINIRLANDDYDAGRFLSFKADGTPAQLIKERLHEYADIGY